ncbi:MAG: ABC transporter permease, partial [Chloroflexota bacterium]
MQQPASTTLPMPTAEEAELAPRRRWRLWARSNAGLYIGGAILVVVVICMAVPGLLTPGDPLALNLGARLLGPGMAGHTLGT